MEKASNDVGVCEKGCDQLPSENEERFIVKLSDIDSIVMNVLEKFVQRSKFGKQKYGTDLDRTDLSVLDWIKHAQEEHMDAILYLEKLKHTITSTNNPH
jgi:hypothetical protein